MSFSVFFLVSTEFSVFFSKDLRVLAFKGRFSEFIKVTRPSFFFFGGGGGVPS